MSYDSINNRFSNAVHVINASCTTQTNATTTGLEVYGSRVTLNPGEAQDGLTFRWNVAGTKTGTNAAHTLSLYSTLSGTPLMTLTADDNTQVDWTAEFILRCYGGAVQKVMGTMASKTTDCECDYAAGTAGLKNGAELYLAVAAGHTSDSVTTEMCVTEAWVK